MGNALKTNAMRILEKNKIHFETLLYESDGFMDGLSIVEKLGLDKERTFKTLVTQGKSKKYFVFVVPVAEELDLKKAAKSVDEKSVEMIHVKEIMNVTGYIRGGCSPIGMKKQFETVLDKSAEKIDDIYFSGGRRGAQIKMNSRELIKLINGKFADIIM